MAAPTMAPPPAVSLPLALCIQPACLEHKYIRHANSSHIFERPERLRAVLLGFAAALSRLEAVEGTAKAAGGGGNEELAAMLSSLSIASSRSPFLPPSHIHLITPPPLPQTPGQILLHHPALQLAHCPPEEAPFPYLPKTRGAAIPSSPYLRNLFKWASEAVETIKATGCEIPDDLGLNPGDLYLGPGSIIAIEGAVQTVCQAVDGVCAAPQSRPSTPQPSTPPSERAGTPDTSVEALPPFNKVFCAIRPPGHHCGEDAPSGFCYVNNVVVGALHGYLQHDVDRAIIIDFDLHHGNGTQALVMPLNAAAYAEDLAMAAGKPPTDMRGKKGARRAWKAFYGSVHDIYSYPCEDGDMDLVKDASLSLAAHGQYIENIHLQPYANEADFYERIYPNYLALLDKALVFMKETEADPERTILFVSAGFDACEHEHQGMQRHDRRVPASFYSRYTRDLAAFADQHTLGKVVSVLEGGYGDRALTSAAMGHAIGLLGREGQPDWLSIPELELLERAVKKRRKGKLCALPADLAANPHIARTHALLAHFEGTAPPETPAPSVNATPQARMTLRARKTLDPNADDSPVPRRAARTKVTPSATPLKHEDVKPDVPDVPERSEAIKTEPVPVLAEAAYPSPRSESPQPSGPPQPSAPILLRIPRVTPQVSPAATPPREMPTTPTPAAPAPPAPPAFAPVQQAQTQQPSIPVSQLVAPPFPVAAQSSAPPVAQQTAQMHATRPTSEVRPPATEVHPASSQGRPPATQARPPATQAHPPASQAHPPATQSVPQSQFAPRSFNPAPQPASHPAPQAARPPSQPAHPPVAQPASHPNFSHAPQQARSHASVPPPQSALPPSQSAFPARQPAPQTVPAGIFFRPQNVESVVLPPTPVRPANTAERPAPVPMPDFQRMPGAPAPRSASGSGPQLTRIVPQAASTLQNPRTE